MVCVDVISRLLWLAPDAFPVLCTLDFPGRLLALIKRAPLFPGADIQTDCFSYDVQVLCYAVDALCRHPAAGEIGAVLWAMGLALIAIDDSHARHSGLIMLRRMARAGFPVSIDAESAQNLTTIASDGRVLLRPLFRLLTTVEDQDFLAEAIAHGLLPVLLATQVQERFEGADLVYHFFADIALDPAVSPALLPQTIDFLDDAPYRTQVAIIRYLSVVFDELSTDAVKELVNKRILAAVGFIIASGENEEAIVCTLKFAGQVLADLRQNGVAIAEDQRVQDLATEISTLIGTLSPEVDEELIAVHQLCVGEA
jgi:hypothetical protein